jgi:hypothetical protein
MKAVAGSILVLGGCILIAAGVIGQDVCCAFNRFPSAAPLAMLSGGIVVVVGAAVTFWGLLGENRPHSG